MNGTAVGKYIKCGIDVVIDDSIYWGSGRTISSSVDKDIDIIVESGDDVEV